MTTALLILAGILILVGLVGVVLPVLPGTVLMLAGMALAAWAGDFQVVGPWTLGLLATLTLVSIAVDVFASMIGAQRAGASAQALLGATLGSLVGIAFGLPGLILGPFLGAAIGETLHARDLRRASQVGVATWLGLLLGTALKAALALAMLGVFGLALLLD